MKDSIVNHKGVNSFDYIGVDETDYPDEALREEALNQFRTDGNLIYNITSDDSEDTMKRYMIILM